MEMDRMHTPLQSMETNDHHCSGVHPSTSSAGALRHKFHDTKTFHQHIAAPIKFDVIFTRDSLNIENSTICSVLDGEAGKKVMVFVDSGVVDAFPELPQKIVAYLHHYHYDLPVQPLIYPGGERVKDGWQHVNHMMDRMIDAHMCRHSFCVAIGGGALLDAVGFASSLVHRGIRLVRMPTTALSQDDSGVGVKNGINYAGVKNIIGAFSAPYAVINDFDFLRTLDAKLIGDGIAEAFKVAIIKDLDFFHYLEKNAKAIRDCHWPVIETVVERAAILHLHHIGKGGDPMERGEARPLDFGHWSAHKLESMSGYEISHGSGVAIGIAIDTVIAYRLNLVTDTERDRIIKAMKTAGLPIFTPLLEKRDQDGSLEVMEGLEEFREHIGGSLCITLPHGIGNRTDIRSLGRDLVEASIDFLKTR